MDKANETGTPKKPPAKDANYVQSRLLMDVDIIERQLVDITNVVVERAVPIVVGRVKAEREPSRLLSINDAAVRLGRTPNAVRRMISRGQIRGSRPPGGSKWGIEERELERFIKQGRGGTQ